MLSPSTLMKYRALYLMLGDASQIQSSGVGFSGVLFCYALIESYHTQETVRSIFGLFNVSAKLYPFILLILIQVILPGISFLGHLSGILVGLLAVSGLLQVVVPSQGIIGFIFSLSLHFSFSLFHKRSQVSISNVADPSPYFCIHE